MPTWHLAHPFRLAAHNGEINTLRGNKNWIASRMASMQVPYLAQQPFLGQGLSTQDLAPFTSDDKTDSGNLDSILELLVKGSESRTLPEAMMMMVPEAWENVPDMDPGRRAFLRFNASLMEAWDGPACVTFTDGTVVGAVLDRNGLRPGRWWQTRDGRVILASEAGVLDVPVDEVISKRP